MSTTLLDGQVAVIEAAAERAAEQRIAEVAKVRSQQNVATFSEEELARREQAAAQAVTEAFEQAAAAALARIDETVASAEKQLAMSERDPMEALSPAELTLAEARRLYLQEDATKLPLVELVRRCRVAADNTDRVQQFLLGRYVGQRLEREWERLQSAGSTPNPTERVTLAELRELVISLNTAVDDQRQARATAEEMLKVARLAKRRALEAHSRGSGAVEKAMAAMRASGRYGAS